MSNPYRDECPECVRRRAEDERIARAAKKRLEPFMTRPMCPMCGHGPAMKSERVCFGDGLFVYYRGIWPFRKKHVVRCEIEGQGGSGHFHCVCPECDSKWMMGAMKDMRRMLEIGSPILVDFRESKEEPDER